MQGNPNTLGDRIKQLQKELNLTQSLFCAATSISRCHLSNLETRKAELTEAFVKKIRSVYNVSADYLLTGDENTKDYPVTEAILAFLRHTSSARKMISDLMKSEADEYDFSANP